MRVALHFEEREILGVVAIQRRGRWVASRQATVAVTESGLSAAVKDILGALGFDMASRLPEVWAVLPRSIGVERILDIPKLQGEALLGVVAHELEAQLPWPIDTVLHGFAVNGRRAGRMSVLAVAVRKDAVEPIFDAIRESGATVVGATLSDLALLGLERDPSRAGATLVVTPVGTNRSEAEVVCLEAGEFRFSRRVALHEAGDSRELGEELAKSARFARESLGLEISSVAVAHDDGDSWDCAAAECVNAFNGQSASSGLGASELGGLPVSGWTPAGAGTLPTQYWAALGALQAARVPNLLETKRSLPGWVKPAAVAISVLLLFSVFLWGYALFQEQAISGLRTQLQQLEEPRAEAARIAGEVTALESELKVWREPGSLADRLIALEEVAASVPSGTGFTGLTISGDRIVDLTGRAPSAVAVVEALQRGRSLSGVALTGPVRVLDAGSGGSPGTMVSSGDGGSSGSAVAGGHADLGGSEEFHIGGGIRR